MPGAPTPRHGFPTVDPDADPINGYPAVFNAAMGGVDDLLVDDGAADVPSLRTLGAGANQAAPGNDPRLGDQRVPADGSVTAAKIAGGAVTPTKVSTGSYAISVTGTSGRVDTGSGIVQSDSGGIGYGQAPGIVHYFRNGFGGGAEYQTVFGGSFTNPSDARLKDAVEDLGGGLGLLRRLRAVRFRWKRDDSPDIGFIAQEVEEVVPEAVAVLPEEDGIELLSLNAAKLVPVLVAALAELDAQVQALRGAA